MTHKPVLTSKSQTAYDRFHYAAGAMAGETLYCSGVIGTGAGGQVPEDIREEFRLAWRAAEEVLQEAGLTLGDVVEYTSYHVGLHSHMRDFMAVRDEFLREPWPAWTAIGISELAVADAHVEIRITAVRA
ncbi:MAG: RidA family protein [Gammaproteobacteria bacterium]|nr:RidA family protein [Gammaproteobacteria bacterium]